MFPPADRQPLIPEALAQLVAPNSASGAVFSRCRRFRYILARRWEVQKDMLVCIGLNPSVANETEDDPTIARLAKCAGRLGFGGLLVGNLFAWVATRPNALRSVADPIGPDNDAWLQALGAKYPRAVALWGNGGLWRDRAAAVAKWFPELRCFAVTRQGMPRHPRGLAWAEMSAPRPWQP